MSEGLPAQIRVLERGWLSANNVLFLEGERAALIDSGYVSHAAQTVELVRHALAGRQLARLINTHSHSDHIGGNAALQAAFGCRISVPDGIAETVHAWDEEALLLSPLGQDAAPFRHDEALHAGQEIELGGLNWQCLAVPGHDMDALAYYNPEQGILISGDALWENGFGVLFPELLGHPDGLAGARATLEMIGRLAVRWVIPGHGSPFQDVAAALGRAEKRLAGFAADSERLVWHAIKVVVFFLLLDKRQVADAALTDFICGMPFVASVNRRYLGLDDAELARRVAAELQAGGVLRQVDGFWQPA